ncbi:MAG: ABC transporter ATP-binding protein [Myxococcota bacterium]|nr:ABC transporter ATP-binding protein [Myxococcota bacterium]
MSTPPAIECTQLRKVYHSGFLRIPYVGLQGLNLEVRQGEIFGFVGPNGAGKTTTIKILMSLQSATEGHATLLGKDCRSPDSKSEVGFLPERPYFYEHLTAQELLFFYGRLFDLRGAELSKRVHELLERVDLKSSQKVPLRNFSKGMLQRAGIAQALINRPKLLVLDEPMSGLDPLGRTLVKDILLEEKKRGTTVFLSSHVLGDVELLADRVGILIDGRLHGCGTVQELVDSTMKHVDCAFRIPNELDLPGKQISHDGDLLQQRLAPEDVSEVLDRVRSAGGEVIQVVPARSSLEDVVAKEVLKSLRGDVP